jgi:hypothetical protein
MVAGWSPELFPQTDPENMVVNGFFEEENFDG